MITVFYDGKCNLCSKEINHYKEISPEGVFNWQDITISDNELKNANISLVEGLKILHAMDENGQIHKGVDASILMWKALGKWRFLAYVISLPLVYQVTKLAYRIFAHYRFKNLSHCQMAARNETNL